MYSDIPPCSLPPSLTIRAIRMLHPKCQPSPVGDQCSAQSAQQRQRRYRLRSKRDDQKTDRQRHFSHPASDHGRHTEPDSVVNAVSAQHDCHIYGPDQADAATHECRPACFAARNRRKYRGERYDASCLPHQQSQRLTGRIGENIRDQGISRDLGRQPIRHPRPTATTGDLQTLLDFRLENSAPP